MTQTSRPYKTYLNSVFGQLHLRVWGAGRSALSPIICLHPAPFSGIAFNTLAPLLCADRMVIAPDFPGYGGSDRHGLTPSIPAYAQAMDAALRTFSGGGPVDIIGFHTGCLVGAQIALCQPRAVRRLCLIDVPTFPPAERRAMAETFREPAQISADIACLAKAWRRGFTSRLDHQPVDDAFAFFAEHLRPGRHMDEGFFAAFSYDWEDAFAALKTDTLVLATKSPLLEASRAAASIIPGAALLERLDIERSVIDGHAERIAPDVKAFLAP